MARFRKIDLQIWADQRFRNLSRPQPNAQFLWIYLLSGEHTTPLPGLFVAGRAGLAEALGWKLNDFDRCFAELQQAGMVVADWANRVIWLPNFLKYNLPDSENVVLGWRSYLPLVPDCPLKHQATAAIASGLSARPKCAQTFAHLLSQEDFAGDDGSLAPPDPCAEGSGKGSGKGMAEGSPNPSPNGPGAPSPEGMPTQEQEQDQDNTCAADAAEQPPGPQPDSAPGKKERKSPAKARTPRPPNALFDAVVEITGTDPEGQGSFVAKVAHALLAFNPAVTPEEVRQLPAAWRRAYPGLSATPISPGLILKNIHLVRTPVTAEQASANDEIEKTRRLLEGFDLEREGASHD